MALRANVASFPLTPSAVLRWRAVSERLTDVSPTRVLELGVGQGSLGARLASAYAYVGVEPDATSRATAAVRLPDGARLLTDIDELDDDESFDLLCAFEVLEHIPDDCAVLARWVRHLRPGGQVLVTVPADPDRFGLADELAGHMRRYSREDLRALLESAGLEVVAVEHYGFPLGGMLQMSSNLIARRRMAREATPQDPATRTASSGRHIQPPAWASRVIWWGVAPFHRVQRRFPDRGPGLVGHARRPT